MKENRKGLNDLITAYDRLCLWMDADPSIALYCVREVQSMQQAFGTSYVVFPAEYYDDDDSLYGLLCERCQNMADRNRLIFDMYDESVFERLKFGTTGKIPDLRIESAEFDTLTALLKETAFKTTTPFLLTMFTLEFPGELVPVGEESPFGEGEDESTPGWKERYREQFKNAILAEHPEIEKKSFSMEELYAFGFPASPPVDLDKLRDDSAYAEFYDP